MSGWWWQCEQCGKKTEFRDVNPSGGIVTFLWEELLSSNWNQDLLLQKCSECRKDSMRITYEFPNRRDPVTVQVLHIIGLPPSEDVLTMMWETFPIKYPEYRWFDFKYLNGRKVRGLTAPAVLLKTDLRALFDFYKEKTGVEIP